LDVSAIVQEQVRQLDIPLTPALHACAPADVVTFADLTSALDSRDEGLKSLIKTNFDALMTVLQQPRDSSTPVVRNFSKTSAFMSPSDGGPSSTSPLASPSVGNGQATGARSASPSTGGIDRNPNTGTFFRNHPVDVSGVHVPLRQPDRDRDGGLDDRSAALSTGGRSSSKPPHNPYHRGIMKGTSPLSDNKRGKSNSVYLFGEHGVTSVDKLWHDDCLLRLGFPFEVHQDLIER
jgi:hypothetical protein